MQRIAVIAGVVVAALAGGLLAAQFLAPKSPEVPVTLADGLPVISVSGAIAVRDGLVETQPIAVFGWFSYGPNHSCSAPRQGEQVGELEMRCHRGEMVLAERAESGIVVEEAGGQLSSVRTRHLDGPYLDPYVSSLSVGDHIHPKGIPPWQPLPIVAVGHVRDHRAIDCGPEDLAFCQRVLVLDHIAIISGVEQRPALRMDSVFAATKADRLDVEQLARDRFGPGATILATAEMRWKELPSYEDRAPVGDAEQRVWLVRGIDRGADGTAAPTLRGLLIDDATLALLWDSASGG